MKIIPFLMIFTFTSCVSKKKYASLQEQNSSLNKEVNNLKQKIDGLGKQNMEYDKKLQELTK